MAREQLTRLITTVAGLIVVVVVVLLLFTGGSSYTIYAQFTDAGQLVNGDLVTVAGHKVGQVSGLSISPNGLASVKLEITDKSLDPLPSTSTATIGQLSLTGIANRFVSLAPGVGGSPIPNNGTLPEAQTKGIVDLDTVLDTLDKPTRDAIAQFFKTGAYLVSGNSPADFRNFALYLNPALSQLTNFGAEVVSDKFALDRLIGSGAQVTQKLASNTSALSGSVSNTAQVLAEIAGQRQALSDTLNRAPAVLKQSDTVLNRVDTTLGDLNPALVALKPAAPKLAGLLKVISPFANYLTPTVDDLRALLPQANAAIQGFPATGKAADSAITALTTALGGIEPILSGLRPYVPDLVGGFFNGVAGTTGSTYDANGHLLHVRLVLSGSAGTLSGLTSILGNTLASVAHNGGTFTNTKPCPGGGSYPTTDGSAPWNNADSDTSVGALCTPPQHPRQPPEGSDSV